jgi:hypothetical protein
MSGLVDIQLDLGRLKRRAVAEIGGRIVSGINRGHIARGNGDASGRSRL